MNILKATKRTTASTGQINKLRLDGFIPAVLYGGKKNNLNISLKKLHLQNIINTGTFMSKVFDLDIDGNSEKALPRDIAYDPVSDEPIHIDFIRIEKGSKLTLEIPVKFINLDKSPGLKKGGVLNIVRRKVELKCPTENIPNEIVVDLDNTEINTSLKISSVKLPENVVPTITDRDFVIATVVAPTILVEPEKVEETVAEGEAATEGTAEGVEGAEKIEGEKDKTAKPSDDKAKAASGDKSKATKPSDDKGKASSSEKGKAASKEVKKK
jgi:large subunit ribosomal protein L25